MRIWICIAIFSLFDCIFSFVPHNCHTFLSLFTVHFSIFFPLFFLSVWLLLWKRKTNNNDQQKIRPLRGVFKLSVPVRVHGAYEKTTTNFTQLCKANRWFAFIAKAMWQRTRAGARAQKNIWHIRRWCVTQMMQFIVMQTEFAHPAKSAGNFFSCVFYSAVVICVRCFVSPFCALGVKWVCVCVRIWKLFTKSFDHFRSSWSFWLHFIYFFRVFVRCIQTGNICNCNCIFTIITEIFVYYNMPFKQCMVGAFVCVCVWEWAWASVLNLENRVWTLNDVQIYQME